MSEHIKHPGLWTVGADPDGRNDCYSIWYGRNDQRVELAGRIREKEHADLFAASPAMLVALMLAATVLPEDFSCEHEDNEDPAVGCPGCASLIVRSAIASTNIGDLGD